MNQNSDQPAPDRSDRLNQAAAEGVRRFVEKVNAEGSLDTEAAAANFDQLRAGGAAAIKSIMWSIGTATGLVRLLSEMLAAAGEEAGAGTYAEAYNLLKQAEMLVANADMLATAALPTWMLDQPEE